MKSLDINFVRKDSFRIRTLIIIQTYSIGGTKRRRKTTGIDALDIEMIL